MGTQETRKKKTEDHRAKVAEIKRLQDLDANRLAIQPTLELGYSPTGIATIDFVNVTTAIGPSQTGGVVIPDTTPPAQVTGVSITAPVPAQLNLTWTANTEPDLNHYNIYRGTSSGFTVVVGTTVPLTTTFTNSYIDTGLSASTTYYYRILAADNTGNLGSLSLQTQGTTQTVDTTPPAQTVGLGVTAVSSSQLNLTWTASTATDLSHYKVYRGTSSGFVITPGVTTPNGTPTTNSFSDTGLTASTTYYYKVLAADTTGNLGALSAQAQGTTQAITTTPPAQVTGLSATPYGQIDTDVFLKWNANTEPDLVQYNIYRGTTAGFTVTPGVTTPFAIVTAPTTEKSGGTYSPSTTYYFKVAAVDTGGDIGARSTEVSASLPTTTTRIQTMYLDLDGTVTDLGPNTFAMFADHFNGYVTPGKFGSRGIRLNYPALAPIDTDKICPEIFTNPITLQMDPAVGFSVSFWIYPQTLSALAFRRTLAEKADSLNQKWTIQMDSAGIVYFFVKKAGTIYKRQVSGFTTGAWQHVAAVFNGATNTLEIYRNGVAGIASTATPQWPGSQPWDGSQFAALNLRFSIGARIAEPSPPRADPSDGDEWDTIFQGYMDEFLWYRSTVLTQAEVTSLMNSNVTGTTGGSAPPAATRNLWLKLDGNYNDSSGFSNTITPSNASGFAGTGQFGGNSVRLNTPTTTGLDHIAVTANTNTALDFVNGFSYSCWIYLQSSNITQYIISKMTDANNWVTLFYNNLNDCLQVDLMKSGTLSSNRTDDTMSVSLNTWHHAVLTYDSSSAKIYLDGDLHMDTTSVAFAASGTTNLIIGNLSGDTSTNRTFRGRIDELMYFKGVFLNAGQVLSLMQFNAP